MNRDRGGRAAGHRAGRFPRFLAFALALSCVEGIRGQTATPFEDVSNDQASPNYHINYNFIQFMKEQGITSGCTTTKYRPGSQIPRDQAAVFMVRAVYWALSGKDRRSTFEFENTIPYFPNDVPFGHMFFSFVQKARELTITSGIGSGLYGASVGMTWGQAAAFAARAWEIRTQGVVANTDPGGCPGIFATHIFAQYYRRVATILGCGWVPAGKNLDDPITRGEIAPLVVRAGMGREASTAELAPPGSGGSSAAMKEYIYLGPRLIATETTAGGGGGEPGQIPNSIRPCA